MAVALEGGTAIGRLRTLRNLAGVHYRVKVLQIYPPPLDRHAVAEVLAQARQVIANQIAAWRVATGDPPSPARNLGG